MTKKERIKELEQRVEELEAEIGNLRGQPMLIYGRVPQPWIHVPYPHSSPWNSPPCTGTPPPQQPHIFCETDEVRTIPTDNPFVVTSIKR